MARIWVSLLLAVAVSHSVLAQAPDQLEAVVTTDLGTFRFDLAPDKAPKHVEQFIARVRQGYYDGSAFHRMFANAMVQGGDPLLKNPKTPKNLWGTGGLNLLPGEYSDMKHVSGVVSTVRIPDKPNSDGAQFFVCISPQPALDGQYTAFGRVTEGLDVVQKISATAVDANAVADKPVRILKITLEPKKPVPFLAAGPEELTRTVTLKTTLGTMKIKMEPGWAAENVRNFLTLVATGWYNGTAFHRISKEFVVQGGTAGSRVGLPLHAADRWVHPVKGEFSPDVKHVRGVISMAHGEDPNSATTSFFLMLGPATSLDGQFSAFGKIVEGIEVLDAFEKEDVDGEKPKRRLEVIEATVDSR